LPFLHLKFIPVGRHIQTGMVRREFADGMQVMVPADCIIAMISDHSHTGVPISAIQAAFKMMAVANDIPKADNFIAFLLVDLTKGFLQAS
jgi:hypothetical protein